MTDIRVLLVDDDPMVRLGVRLLIENQPDIAVVGEASDGDEVVAAVQEHAPDVILMDLIMQRMNGIDATAAVRSLPNPPHVIALTTWDVDDAVVRAVEAGAAGFLLKTATRDVAPAIRAVMEGDAVLSPKSTRQLLDRWGERGDAGRSEASAAMDTLTDRERGIAAIVGEGLTTEEISKRVFLSPATVKSHLSSIQTKLGVHNRTQVAVLAERAGLVQGF